MKALTLQQPWAWAVCHAGKRCENRAWLGAPGLLAVARSLVGQRFAVHAAAGTGTAAVGLAAVDFMIDRGLVRSARTPEFPRIPNQADLPRGAIVATARLDAVVRTLDNGCRIPEGNIIASCMLCRDMLPSSTPCPHADPWAIPGTVGLVLADVRVLPVPVPCKGAQGWWTVPEGVEVAL